MEHRPFLRSESKLLIVFGVVIALLSACASATEPAVPPLANADEVAPALAFRDGEPEIRVINLEDGATVTSPVRIEVQVDNYMLAPKGVSRDGEGHFHVMTDQPCVAPGDVIGDEHTHIGNGAAVVEIELDPGPHQLCLQLGDGFHTALEITTSLRLVVVD